MTFNIETFKNQGLPWGGARPSLFAITFTTPAGITELTGASAATSKLSYQGTSTEIPAATLGIVEVGYFGRKIKVAGDRTFADWTVNMICDEDMISRSFFEAWSNGINELEANVRETSAMNEGGSGASAGDPTQSGYKVDMQITQYGKDGAPIRGYSMIGAWPVEVGAITVDWDNQNQYIKFPVRFAYDYWLPFGTGGTEILSPRGGTISYGGAVDSPQASDDTGT